MFLVKEKIKMLVLLVFYLGFCQAQTRETVTGSLDEKGVCQCSMFIPDTTFPADKMEILEAASYNMSIKVQRFETTLNYYVEKLKNLTRKVEVIEIGGVSYTELDFKILKEELNEMETIIADLKASLNGSNTKVDSLYMEIYNISTVVRQLEKYDKNNVLSVRREMAILRNRLNDCKTNNVFEYTPIDYGTCDHGGIVNISKPFVVQLNYGGFSNKYGGWGKDSFLGTNQKIHWVSLLISNQYFSSIRLYSSYDDLLLNKNFIDKTVSSSGNGAGMILYNNSLYYNCYNSKDICKLSMSTNTIQRQTLPMAVYHNRFSYSSSLYQDIDLACDENGVWVIYSTEEEAGNMVIGKLDSVSLALEKTWVTSQYKPSASNAFMVCGVLYATRAINTRKEEIFYMYDTKTGKEGKLSIVLDKIMENVQSLSYNPNDHRLYMFTDGYQVYYDVIFGHPPDKETFS